jgi:hypothetical protein
VSDHNTTERFDLWAIVEMLGHRRVVGRVTEQVIAGAGFIRIDIPAEDGSIGHSQIIAPGSVYAITPLSEDAARIAAHRQVIEPVTVWDLPQHIRHAIEASTSAEDIDDDGGQF